MSIHKVIELINDKAKFNSAYYFSIKDVQQLTSKKIGKCFENALILLREDGIPKLNYGLKQFSTDTKIVNATIEIFETVVESCDTNDIGEFCKQKGLLSLIEIINNNQLDLDFARICKILELCYQKYPNNQEYIKYISNVIDVCTHNKNHKYMRNLLETAIHLTSKEYNEEIYINLDVKSLTNFIKIELISGSEFEIINLALKLLMNIEQNLHRGLSDSNNIVDLMRYCDEESSEKEILVTILSKMLSYDEVYQALESIKNKSSISEELLSKLNILSFNNSLVQIVGKLNIIEKLLKLLDRSTHNATIQGLCMILGAVYKSKLKIFTNKEINDATSICIKVIQSSNSLQLLNSIGYLLMSLMINVDSFSAFIKSESYNKFLTAIANNTKDYQLMYTFSQFLYYSSFNEYPVLQLIADQRIFKILVAGIDYNTPQYILNYCIIYLSIMITKLNVESINQYSDIYSIIDKIPELKHNRLYGRTLSILNLLTQFCKDNSLHTSKIEESLAKFAFALDLDSNETKELIIIYDQLNNENLLIALLDNVSTKNGKNNIRYDKTNLKLLCILLQTRSYNKIKDNPNLQILKKTAQEELKKEIQNNGMEDNCEFLLLCIHLLIVAHSQAKGYATTMSYVSKCMNASTNEELAQLIVEKFKIISETIILDDLTDEELLAIMSSTIELIGKTNDFKSVITNNMMLLENLAVAKKGALLNRYLKLGLVNIIMECLQKLKIFVQVQMQIYDCIEALLDMKNDNISNSFKNLRLIDILSSIKNQQAAKSDIKTIIHRIIFKLSPENYLEDQITEILKQFRKGYNNKNIEVLCEAMDNLVMILKEERAVQILSYMKFDNDIKDLLSYLSENKNILEMRSLIAPTFLLIQQLSSMQQGIQILTHKINGFQLLNCLLLRIMRLSPVLLEKEINIGINCITLICTKNSSLISSTWHLIATSISYLNEVEFEFEACEKVGNLLQIFPVELLLTNKEFVNLIDAIKEWIVQLDTNRIALTAVLLSNWLKNEEMAQYLIQLGVEAHLYIAAMNSGSNISYLIESLEQFSFVTKWLEDDDIRKRIDILFELYQRSRDDKDKLKIITILANLTQSTTNVTPFNSNQAYIKIYKYAMENLLSKYNIGTEISIILSKMSTEDILIFLLSQIYDQLKAQNSAKYKLFDLKLYINEISIYLQLQIKSCAIVYKLAKNIIDILTRRIETESKFKEINLLPTIKFMKYILTNASRSSIDNEKDISILLNKSFIEIVYEYSKSTYDLDALDLLTLFMNFAGFKTITMDLLKNYELLNSAYHILEEEKSSIKLKKILLMFLTNLCQSVEGYYINYSVLKTLYSKNSVIIEIIMRATEKWTSICAELSSYCIEYITATIDKITDDSLILLYAKELLNCINNLSQINIMSQAHSLSAFELLLNKVVDNSYIIDLYKAKLSIIKKQFIAKSIPYQETPEIVIVVSNALKQSNNTVSIDNKAEALDLIDMLLQECDLNSNLAITIIKNLQAFLDNISNNKAIAEDADFCSKIVLCILPHLCNNTNLFMDHRGILFDAINTFLQSAMKYPAIKCLLMNEYYADIQKAFKLEKPEKSRGNIVDCFEIYVKINQIRSKGQDCNTTNGLISKSMLSLLCNQIIQLASYIKLNNQETSDYIYGLRSLALLKNEVENLSDPLALTLKKQVGIEIIDECIITINELSCNSPQSLNGLWLELHTIVYSISEAMNMHSIDKQIHRLTLLLNSKSRINLLSIIQLVKEFDKSSIPSNQLEYQYILKGGNSYLYLKKLLQVIIKYATSQNFEDCIDIVYKFIDVAIAKDEINDLIKTLYMLDPTKFMSSNILDKILNSKSQIGMIGMLAKYEHEKSNDRFNNKLNNSDIIDTIVKSMPNNILEVSNCCYDLMICNYKSKLIECELEYMIIDSFEKLQKLPSTSDNEAVFSLLRLCSELPTIIQGIYECINNIGYICATFHTYYENVVLAKLPFMKDVVHAKILLGEYAYYKRLQPQLHVAISQILENHPLKLAPIFSQFNIDKNKFITHKLILKLVSMNTELNLIMNFVPFTIESNDTYLIYETVVKLTYEKLNKELNSNERIMYNDLNKIEAYKQLTILTQNFVNSNFVLLNFTEGYCNFLIQRLKFQQTLLNNYSLQNDVAESVCSSEWKESIIADEPFVPLINQIPTQTTPKLWQEAGLDKSQLKKVYNVLSEQPCTNNTVKLMAYISCQKFEEDKSIVKRFFKLFNETKIITLTMKYYYIIMCVNVFAINDIQKNNYYSKIKRNIVHWESELITKNSIYDQAFLNKFFRLLNNNTTTSLDFIKLATWDIDLSLN